MRRLLFAALWTSLAATAQFSDLAVTEDGGRVYFVSALPLKGDTGASVETAQPRAPDPATR